VMTQERVMGSFRSSIGKENIRKEPASTAISGGISSSIYFVRMPEDVTEDVRHALL
jgi:hypothetical protein